MKKNKKLKLFGGVWFIVGTIIRYNAMYVSVGFFAVICFAELFRQNDKLADKIKRVFYQLVLPIIGLFCIAIGVRYLGKCIINTNQQWQHLFDKNVLSEKLLDYELYPYEEFYEEYQKWGISENDRRMVEVRMSNGDDDYFTMDLYHVFIEHFSEKWEFDVSVETLEMWVKELAKYLVHSCFGGIVLASLLAEFLCGDVKNKIIVFLTSSCMLCYLFLFCMMGRVVDRVSFGVYLWGIIVLITSCDFRPPKKMWKMTIRQKQIVKFCSVLFILVFAVGMSVKHQRKTNETIAELYDYMEQGTEYFYFYSGFSEYRSIENLLLMHDYWDTRNSFYSSNYDICPNEKVKLHEYGIENIYKDSVDSEVIRFINRSDMDIIETYIREHYCSTARAVGIDELGEYTVYRIVS